MNSWTSDFKLYISLVMKDKINGPAAFLVKGILRILSWLYAIGIKIVDWGYCSGLRRKYSVGIPVVSVGNITLGGTGKTPFTMYLADHFYALEKKPAVLIRGYGRDESKMIKDELPEVPVFVGQNRVKNARAAEASGQGVLILDDGFQHRRLERDLDIALIDGVTFLGNGCLFPRGILRELPASLARADMIVVTKADRIDGEQKNTVTRRIKEIAPHKPLVWAVHRASCLNDVTGAICSAQSLDGQRISMVSGIGDPDHFSFLIEKCGAEVVSRLDFSDHHDYNDQDVKKILKEGLRAKADRIIVTKKDYVKLSELDISDMEDKLFVLNIVIDIVDGKENLIAGLNSIYTGQGS